MLLAQYNHNAYHASGKRHTPDLPAQCDQQLRHGCVHMCKCVMLHSLSTGTLCIIGSARTLNARVRAHFIPRIPPLAFALAELLQCTRHRRHLLDPQLPAAIDAVRQMIFAGSVLASRGERFNEANAC